MGHEVKNNFYLDKHLLENKEEIPKKAVKGCS